MEALEFSVPYNNNPALLDLLFKLKGRNNNKISEIFLCGPQEYFGSGRVTTITDMEWFEDAVRIIHGQGIKVNLVLNSTCEGSEWYSTDVMEATVKFIGEVHTVLGVEAVTIANPLYVDIVRRHFKDIEIHASVLGDIDCVQRAVIFRDAGADVISTDVNINRNLELLKRIKAATGARIKLLVNEGCLYKCPFRKFHFNATSHYSREALGMADDTFAGFFNAGCGVIKKDHSQLLRSGWIRPEDLRRYSEITDYFKVVGRAQLDSFILRATRAYLEESWNGDMLDIVSGCSKRFSMVMGARLDNKKLGELGFFEKVTACDNNCEQCGFCQALAENVIRLNMFTQIKRGDTLYA
jgi:collagenase-like PrtC family protease